MHCTKTESEEQQPMAVAPSLPDYHHRDGWAAPRKDQPLPQEDSGIHTLHEAVEHHPPEVSFLKKRKYPTETGHPDPVGATSTLSTTPQRLCADGGDGLPADSNGGDGDKDVFSPKKRPPASRPIYSLTSFLSDSLSAAAAMMVTAARRPGKLAALTDTAATYTASATRIQPDNAGAETSIGVKESLRKLFRGGSTHSSSDSNGSGGGSKYQVRDVQEQIAVEEHGRDSNLRVRDHSNDTAIKYAIGSGAIRFKDRDPQQADRDSGGDRIRPRGDINTFPSHSTAQQYYQKQQQQSYNSLPMNAMQQRSSGMVSRAGSSNKRPVDAVDPVERNPVSGLRQTSSNSSSGGGIQAPPSKSTKGILQVNYFFYIVFI